MSNKAHKPRAKQQAPVKTPAPVRKPPPVVRRPPAPTTEGFGANSGVNERHVNLDTDDLGFLNSAKTMLA